MSRTNPSLQPTFRGRLHRLLEGKSPRRIKVSKSLRFFHEILGLEHLQYGLWQGEPLNLKGLEAAQERYVETLHSWIPPDVNSILDIGAGTGAGAARLKEAGFDVEGLSPDPYQQELYHRRVGQPFHLTRLQELTPERSYDLALMSESAQYIWLESFFPSIREIVSGGYLLLSDYFVTDDNGSPQAKSGHLLDRFLEQAQRHGFTLERREDVTDRAMPTLDLAAAFLDRYALPAGKLAADFFHQDHPHLFRLTRWLLRKQRRKIDDARALVDSDEFRRVKRYLFLLFRVP